jgi:hypothetical protein
MGPDAIFSAIVSTQMRIGLGLELRLLMNDIRRQRRYCFMDLVSVQGYFHLTPAALT